MCTFKVVYSIRMYQEDLSLSIENSQEDNLFSDETNAVFEFNNRKEATAKFYELVKGRLSSYIGYDLFHDSPDYILPFLDSELEEEWLKIKDGSNTYKRIFFKSLILEFDKESYEIDLHGYDFICQTAINYECIHMFAK